MRSFPPTFTAELSRPGCMPYWLLKLVATTGTYYLSDNDRYIAALSAQAYGVVKSFGQVRQGISSPLTDYQISEYSVDLLLGLAISPGGMTIDTLASGGYLDDCQADLYLGLDGISDAPQMISPGQVRDFGEMSDSTLPIMIQDLTVALERTYIGEKVTPTSYPLAAAADVGKMIPIPFGDLPKIPAVILDSGAQTALSAAATASDTTLYVSNTSGLVAGETLLLESEQVYIESVGSYTVLATRGYNSTTAAAHAKGCAVITLKTLAFCPSWRAVTAIPKVWLRHSDIDHDITALTTRYTGQYGSQLSGYGSMAMVTISPAGMVAVAAMLAVGITDTIATAAQDQYDTLSLDTFTVSGTVEYVDNIIDGNLQSGCHFFVSSSVTLKKVKLESKTGTPSKIRLCVQAGHPIFSESISYQLRVSGSLVGSVSAGGTSSATYRSAWWDFADWALLNASNTYVYAQTSSDGATHWAWEVWLEVRFGPASDTTDVPGVAKTGTVTLSGSLVGELFGSGKVLVDVSSDLGSPTGLCNWVLSQAGLPAVQVVGALAASVFTGLINEYKTGLQWLNSLAFQAGAWFMLSTGTPRLVSRVPGSAVKVISACIASEDGRRSVTRTRTDLTDVIDMVQVWYSRDWSKAAGDDAYTAATAVGGTGSRERPELFTFDFIAGSSEAIALRDLYLSRCAVRRWIYVADYWIDQACVESGDTVQLSYLGGVIGVVLPAEHAPGSMDAFDTVKISVLI